MYVLHAEKWHVVTLSEGKYLTLRSVESETQFIFYLDCKLQTWIKNLRRHLKIRKNRTHCRFLISCTWDGGRTMSLFYMISIEPVKQMTRLVWYTSFHSGLQSPKPKLF